MVNSWNPYWHVKCLNNYRVDQGTHLSLLQVTSRGCAARVRTVWLKVCLRLHSSNSIAYIAYRPTGLQWPGEHHNEGFPPFEGPGISLRQGWVVDWAPSDLRSGPTNGCIISTPLPIKLLSLASPSRHLDLNQMGKDVKSKCSGSLKQDRHGLSWKSNKRSDTGTGGLGVLPAHENKIGNKAPNRSA